MNRYVQQLFESIRNEANSHTKEIGRILSDYQNAKKSAAAFKDESTRISTAAQKARNAVMMQINAFSSSIQPDISNLRNELYTHILTAPSDKVTNALNLYGRIDDISEIEASALLEKCNGNYIALRMLDSIIKKGGLRVKFPDMSEYENDLRILEALSSEAYVSPDEYFSPLCEILVGTPRAVPGALEAGYSWSINNLATARAVFTAHVAEIPDMAKRWTGEIKPTIFRSDVYGGDGVEAAAAFVADTERRSKGTIQPDLDAAAAARAQAHVERAREAQEIRERYIKH